MKTVDAEIKGISGILMHRFSVEEQTKVSEGGAVGVRPEPTTQAEQAAYRLPPAGKFKKGELYIPSENLRRAMVNGAAYEKGRGRSTLQKFAAAAIFIHPDVLTLGVEEYVIDSRAVVVPATKGRVVRHRPRLDEWKLKFTLEYDDTLLTERQLRATLDHTGSKVGLCDFRPEKKGPYGRFMTTLWSPIETREKEIVGASASK